MFVRKVTVKAFAVWIDKKKLKLWQLVPLALDIWFKNNNQCGFCGTHISIHLPLDYHLLDTQQQFFFYAFLEQSDVSFWFV